MDLRINLICALVLALGLAGFASPSDQPAPDKEKNTIKSLFDGLPQELRAKVQSNPVRCDRVNDWLQENVNGKGRVVEIRLELQDILPVRRENGYVVLMSQKKVKINVLDAEWNLSIADEANGPATPPRGFNARTFSFEGVKAADAEKLADQKDAVITGKVKEVAISRVTNQGAPYVAMILEDVLVDGKKWTPLKRPAGGFGIPGDGGGGAKGKGKGTKKEPPP